MVASAGFEILHSSDQSYDLASPQVRSRFRIFIQFFAS